MEVGSLDRQGVRRHALWTGTRQSVLGFSRQVWIHPVAPWESIRDSRGSESGGPSLLGSDRLPGHSRETKVPAFSLAPHAQKLTVRESDDSLPKLTQEESFQDWDLSI